MFENIISRLMELQAPTTRKLKIPLAGTRAFEVILKSKKITNAESAISMALGEFVKYSNDDIQIVSDFKKIIEREFLGLNSTKMLKKKARALKEIWEIEARTLATKNKRNKWLSIRVTEKEYETISKQAQAEGLDISSYIRKQLGLDHKS